MGLLRDRSQQTGDSEYSPKISLFGFFAVSLTVCCLFMFGSSRTPFGELELLHNHNLNKLLWFSDHTVQRTYNPSIVTVHLLDEFEAHTFVNLDIRNISR